MLKAGLVALAALCVFALVFALWPSGQDAGVQTGARLQGVALTLYPSRDPEAVWRFKAADVTSDPLKGETRLAGLSDGGRWVKERGKDGQPTGRTVLDATLAAPDLTIDGQDNLLTRQAKITLVRECADIDLRGTEDQPVRVEQGAGFSAPVATVDSPALVGRVTQLRMSFDFVVEDSGPSNLGWDPDATEICENGKRVPLGNPAQTGSTRTGEAS